MNFVLDASVAAGWFLPDERSEYTEAGLEDVSGPVEAIVPAIWFYEIHNVVLKGIRRGRVTIEVAGPLLAALRQLRPRQRETEYESIFNTAKRFGLSFYDASYLDLAITRNLPLATMDNGL